MSSGSVGRRGLEGLLFIIVRQKWRASALSRFAGYRFCVLSMQPRALANNDRANSFSREEAQFISVRMTCIWIFDLVPDQCARDEITRFSLWTGMGSIISRLAG